MSEGTGDFQIRISRVRAFIQKDVKRIIRIEGVKHFKQSFVDEGFTNDVLKPWPDISQKRKDQKRKKNGNLPKILTDTGDLGNSIMGAEDTEGVTFSSDKNYAQRHNEGLDGMPKRQFMGPSKVLTRAIEKKIEKGIGRIMGSPFK